MNSNAKHRRASTCWSRPLVARSAAFVACVLAPVFAAAQSGLGLPQWFEQSVVQRIKIAGFRRLSYHDHQVTGDGEAFSIGNYGGQGDKRFTDFGNVRMTGSKVFNAVNFDVVFQDSRFQDPQAQKFNIDYDNGPWKVNIGDVWGSMLGTNRFASFTKSLRGVSVGYQGGGFSAKSVYSDVRGAPKTVSFNGTNSAGPYYLQSSQIVRGSETVMIDGVQQSLGEDYTINYETGSITFVNRSTFEAKIVPPTSTIVATYEVFGFTGSRGQVRGLGLSYALQGFGTLGLTGLEQKTGGNGSLSTRLEKFQGFGSASTPYFLQFAPLTSQPIIVKVNGILQTETVDYYFDADNPSIFYFTRFMAATDEIDVLYTPLPTQTVDGDREVVGWDLRLPIKNEGGKGTLTISQAMGSLKNTPTPSSGLSRSLDLRYDHGKTTFMGNVREVPPGFVSIESVGFNRNEKAIDLRASIKATSILTYEASHSNSSIAVRKVDSLGNVEVNRSRFTRSSIGLKYTPSDEMPWTVTHSRLRSSNSIGRTSVDTTDVTTSRKGDKWEAALTFQHQDARGPVSATEIVGVGLDTVSLKTSYLPTTAFSLNLSAGMSHVQKENESGTGRDIQFGLNWRPTGPLSGSLTYQESDAGQVATLGQFSSGFGNGFGGNGFSGGTGGSPLTSAAKVRSLTAKSSWSPTDGISVGVRAYSRETQGSFSSNTRTKGLAVDSSWTLTPYMSLQASIDSSRTEFVGTSVATANTVVSAYLDGAPPGRWSWHAGINQLFSGGGSAFDQESRSLDASVGYRLSDKHSFSIALYDTSSTGQFAQNDSDLSVNYQYRIWRSLALQGSYRIRRVENLDPAATTGAYRSNGFDLELVFNFGS